MKRDSWSITLVPHRSLTRRGYYYLMAFVILANAIPAVTFLKMGAWPIAGFLGADVALIWWALNRNTRDQYEAERITADEDVVTLHRLLKTGESNETRFNRAWLRVELEYDEIRELVGRLRLCSKSEKHEIAKFLGAEERASLATALRQRI